MKLSDFNRVSELRADRDYYSKVLTRARFSTPGQPIRVGDHDLRPNLVERIMPEIACAAETEIKRVDEELMKLGVEV